MKTKFALTNRDILVVMGCIAFLLLNIGAIGSSGRRKAKDMVQKLGQELQIQTQMQRDSKLLQWVPHIDP